MINPMINPPQNYSGVTIQIANPSVYAGQNSPSLNSDQVRNLPMQQNNIPNSLSYNTYPQQYMNPYCSNTSYNQPPLLVDNPTNLNGLAPIDRSDNMQPMALPTQNERAVNSQVPSSAYPLQYYLNNYNYQNNYNGSDNKGKENDINGLASGKNLGANGLQSENLPNSNNDLSGNGVDGTQNNLVPDEVINSKDAMDNNSNENQDLSKSQAVIDDLDARAAAEAKSKENVTKKKIVALTDEYIKSLENYLDNPNDEIRVMASKEILTRLDEDKDRHNDAALNALLNKMLQDPSKLIRVAALSAFASQLASGNEYTVQLLQNIQQNPNADKEDVLQAADILLKMSTDTEVKNIPNPAVKEKDDENTGK